MNVEQQAGRRRCRRPGRPRGAGRPQITLVDLARQLVVLAIDSRCSGAGGRWPGARPPGSTTPRFQRRRPPTQATARGPRRAHHAPGPQPRPTSRTPAHQRRSATASSRRRRPLRCAVSKSALTPWVQNAGHEREVLGLEDLPDLRRSHPWSGYEFRAASAWLDHFSLQPALQGPRRRRAIAALVSAN